MWTWLTNRNPSPLILYVIEKLFEEADQKFMYLTVPLPIAQTRTFKCHYVPLDPESPQIRIRLLIPLNASFMQVKERIAAVTGAKANHVSDSFASSANDS